MIRVVPRRIFLGAALLVVLALLAAFVLPPYYTGLLAQVGIFAIVTLGLNVFMGYAGQVSLGQAAFLGIGAYTSAMLALRLGVTPWIGAFAGAFAAGVVAYGLSFIILRLRENLLALATLALGIVVNVAFNEWDFVGGSSGLKGIPGFFPGVDGTTALRLYAVLAWVLFALVLAFTANLVASNYGRALIAISAGDLGAATLGIEAERLKRQVFVLAAVFAGAAGSIFASYSNYIDPSSFSFLLSVNFVLMSVIGGLRSLWGAVLGALIVVALGQVLQAVVPIVLPSARGDFQSFFFGIILVAILIALPRGIVGRWEERAA